MRSCGTHASVRSPTNPERETYDGDFVILKLIARLRERMEKPLDDDTKVASVRLFGWLAANGQWHHLEGFPAFSDEGASSTPMKLHRHEDDASERPLAPVRTWPEATSAVRGPVPPTPHTG